MPVTEKKGVYYAYATKNGTQVHLGTFRSYDAAFAESEKHSPKYSCECGETDHRKFHHGYKSICAKCRNKNSSRDVQMDGIAEVQSALMQIPTNPGHRFNPVSRYSPFAEAKQ